ncbi:Mitochondrial import inner membrane translocase subunit Tim9 [Perkinsus olseni]|uniref:Ribonuclease n=1 Tax=Perkinsus olseni TaxID=32597 RepID=A0A7J6L6H7_PEROL|nr:Mitochondrial import inner membrane translocase subunit Tim9 [Perkinsus olseni]
MVTTKRQRNANHQPTAASTTLPPSLPRSMEEDLLSSSGVAPDIVIGVDEAGRGPLCGPVVAAAVFIDRDTHISHGLCDSKSLSDEGDREMVYQELTSNKGVKWSVGIVDNKTIDNINILQATFSAMAEAVTKLVKCGKKGLKYHILIDGNKTPAQLNDNVNIVGVTPVVKGDGKEMVIAAASIIAKVTRDRIMHDINDKIPQYNLSQHKGYPTAAHMAVLRRLGPSKYHRLTFAPLKGNWQWSKDEDQQQQQQPIRVTTTNHTPTTRYTKKDGGGIVQSSVMETITDNNNQIFEYSFLLMAIDKKIVSYGVFSVFLTWMLCVEGIDAGKKYSPDYDPEPYFFRWKRQFLVWAQDRRYRGVQPTTTTTTSTAAAEGSNAMVNKEMQDMQVNESLQTYNGLVERCFNQCIQNFRAKNVDYEETDCVKRCVGKFMTYSQRVGTRFAEKNQQVAQDQQAAAAAASAAGHP